MCFRLFITFCLITLAYSDCVIISFEEGPPQPAIGQYQQPQNYTGEWPDPQACPEFINMPSCCTGYTNGLESDNFQKLKTAFGNQGGGCDLCAANLQRFFCYYSCSPNQSDFMSFQGYETLEVIDDDTNLPVMLNVTIVNISVNAELACSIYESCAKISFLSEISAGNSALGFITFMFDRGTPTSYTKDLTSISNTGGMVFTTPAHMCNESYPSGKDQFGYPAPGNCSCNFCRESCAPLDLIEYGRITDGFKASSVIIGYLVAILLTIGCTFIKSYRNKKRNAIVQDGSLHQNLLSSN